MNRGAVQTLPGKATISQVYNMYAQSFESKAPCIPQINNQWPTLSPEFDGGRAEQTSAFLSKMVAKDMPPISFV